MALNPSANDRTRESHAKEMAGSLLHPAIVDVEFPEYQKLLDAAEETDTPFTLPDMPSPPAAPSVSGQKRGGTHRSEEDTVDTGTSGASALYTFQTANQASGSTGPPTTPAGPTPASLRAVAMDEFLKDPLIDPEQMAV